MAGWKAGDMMDSDFTGHNFFEIGKVEVEPVFEIERIRTMAFGDLACSVAEPAE